MGVGGQSHTPTASPPGEREPVHTVQEAGWAGLDGCEKSRTPPSGFDPWTVQPVQTRYTD